MGAQPALTILGMGLVNISREQKEGVLAKDAGLGSSLGIPLLWALLYRSPYS